ncbi:MULTISPECIES: guanylate kinase [unclassified Lacticaseibacillus]|uniref:guanylate kinase n=1 Tax=unclassified Lacticaseibacillus TaxID=2759744 RepID=UPI001941A69C|nr:MULTISPECIES: guanylate kinase [unclassified Lacticaseibacillus]
MQRKLIVITGATGTGKTTVSSYLKKHYGVDRVMTHTTRPRRPGEVDGVDYFFETPESFAANHYIEHVTYAGYEYGSSYESLNRAWTHGDFVSIVLDTKGALTYARQLGNRLAVLYLTIEDPSILRRRLLSRGDPEEMVAKRLASPEYKRDLQLPAGLTDVATVIKNDDWQQACRQIDAFMQQLTQAAVAKG